MTEEVEKTEECCASCGIAEVELKKCACKLVQYCSVDCQKNHRSQHKKLCKKRLAEMAELRDKDLFTQPDSSHLGECPICCLPLPLDYSKFRMTACCCKMLCQGCSYANQKREHEAGLERRCAFCREPMTMSDKEELTRLMKRVKKNDPVALNEMGKYCRGKGDYGGAFKYFTKAAGLGVAKAHYDLACLYYNGHGVGKDDKKIVYHLEQAAIAGHPQARHSLGTIEYRNGRIERAVKHWVIAAKLGFEGSLDNLRRLCTVGKMSKEDYAAALRTYQAAVDATKSPKREEAKSFLPR